MDVYSSAHHNTPLSYSGGFSGKTGLGGKETYVHFPRNKHFPGVVAEILRIDIIVEKKKAVINGEFAHPYEKLFLF